MSRRHTAEKREINPDPKYGNVVVSKFMNSVMREGKKSVAERIVYGALDIGIDNPGDIDDLDSSGRGSVGERSPDGNDQAEKDQGADSTHLCGDPTQVGWPEIGT